MLIKTHNSIYQLSRKGNEYTLIKLEALVGKPAFMTTGCSWVGDHVEFANDGCLYFYCSNDAVLRTSYVIFEEE